MKKVTLRMLMILIKMKTQEKISLERGCYGLPSTTISPWLAACYHPPLAWSVPRIVTYTHLCTGQHMETIWTCCTSYWLVELILWLPLMMGGLHSTQQPGGTAPPVWRLYSTTHQSTAPLMVETLLSTWHVSRTTGTRWSCSWPTQLSTQTWSTCRGTPPGWWRREWGTWGLCLMLLCLGELGATRSRYFSIYKLPFY